MNPHTLKGRVAPILQTSLMLALTITLLLAPSAASQALPPPVQYVDRISLEDPAGDVVYYSDGFLPGVPSQSRTRDALDIRTASFQIANGTLLAEARLASFSMVGAATDPTFAAFYVDFGFGNEARDASFSLTAIFEDQTWRFRAFKFVGFDSDTTEYPASGWIDMGNAKVHLETNATSIGFRPGDKIPFGGVVAMSVDESYRTGQFAAVRQYDESKPVERLGLRHDGHDKSVTHPGAPSHEDNGEAAGATPLGGLTAVLAFGLVTTGRWWHGRRRR